MSEITYIAKHPQLEPSQDYSALRSEGIGHIERLAHNLWSDYNVHDPGVSILELLCYAITDLGYRTSYPIEDLLTRETLAGIEQLGDFHTARQVMTCNPVTFSDLAKLLVDVPGVRNAWVEANREQKVCLDKTAKALVHCGESGKEPQVLNGLYNVYLEFEDSVRDSSAPHHAGLNKRLPRFGGYTDVGEAGIRFDCERALRLESVSVYAESAGDLVIRLRNRRGRVLQTVETFISRANRKIRIDLDFEVPAGTGYKLDAQGSSVRLFMNPPVAGRIAFPMQLPGLINLRNSFNDTSSASDTYYFFYDWVISYEIGEAGSQALDGEVQLSRADVWQAVRGRLQRHRNLCQDTVQLCELVPEEVAVCADLELKVGKDAEQVLSEIFVRLRQHVSPPVRFYSLQEMLDKGRSSEEIFAGPALDHGFIDDDEFGARRRRCEIRASDVTRILLDIEGVLAVHSLQLLAFEKDATEPHAQDAWLLPLSDAQTRAPVFKWERSKIVFYQNRLPLYPDRGRVQTLLREHREDTIRRRKRSEQEPHDLPIPGGSDRAVADYYPLQNELPMTYRVGTHRVPEQEPPRRHAQAKQLKAYLMFFEQLLANYLSQLQHMYELFSWQPGFLHTYFTQPVSGIAGLDELFLELYADEGERHLALQQIIEDEASAAQRRNDFLNHLLARFCEDFTDYSLLIYRLYGDEQAALRLIEDKRAYLADYPQISSGRGLAHDYRNPGDPDNLSGYQDRLYRMLGFADLRRRNLAGHELHIDSNGSDPQQPWRFILNIDGDLLFESRGCNNRDSAAVLLDLALQLGGDTANYQEDGDVHALVRECDGDDDPRPLGRTTDDALLTQVVAYFDALAQARGFHLVEHILLRPRSEDDTLMPVQLDEGGDCPCVEVLDPYSFRMSVILPSWPSEFQDSRFRSFVEETIRREAPAQVVPRICWVSHAQMQAFEQAYDAWQDSLAQLTAAEPDCETQSADSDYSVHLSALIDIMHQLDNVHPLARLHDCGAAQGDTPRVFLDHSNLGTF